MNRKRERRALRLQTRKLFSAACVAACCAGCAATPPQPPLPEASGAQAALLRQDWSAAQPALALQLRNDLRNGYLQFLYALTYDRQSQAGDGAQLDMAQVGYETALQFTPRNYWAQLMMGFLQLERGDYDAAQDHFAAAALDQPQRWEAFYGLGVASYYRADLPMLQLAAKRSLQLAPDQPDALRLSAYALALEGDPEARTAAQATIHTAQLPADAGRFMLRRVDELLAQNMPSEAGAEAQAGEPEPAIDVPKQMVADVTIILSSVVEARNRGINLFDGLRLQYGYDNSYGRQSSTTRSDGLVSSVREGTRAITSRISIPQINYSLNLFNDSNQYYGVIARPSLTAYLGRESEFFAGRTISVAVSGINLGELQPIDVGVRLKLTPEEISFGNVRFRVRVARSFLSREAVGSFQQSLTTFQQFVEATSELQFGQTLILSALSESVNDSSVSKVPVAGDIPGLDLLLKNDSGIKRQETLLILVTPSLQSTLRLPSDPLRRRRGAEDLLRYWTQVVDPGSDVAAIVGRLQHLKPFRKPEPGDLPYRPARADALIREAVEENLRLAQTH